MKLTWVETSELSLPYDKGNPAYSFDLHAKLISGWTIEHIVCPHPKTWVITLKRRRWFWQEWFV